MEDTLQQNTTETTPNATGSETQAQARNKAARQRPIQEPLSFGKTMLASMVGFLLASLVLTVISFIFFAVMIFGMLNTSVSQQTVVKEHTFVRIDCSQAIADTPQDEIAQLLAEKTSTSIYTLLTAIQQAKDDAKVDGLYLYFGNGGTLTWTQAAELRQAVKDFKRTGKTIVAYGNAYSQPSYYLATIANEVAVNPSGLILFTGIAAEAVFYKDLLDKVGVEMQLIRPNSNAYKSAGEAYTRTSFSDDNRTQTRSYVSSIWNHVLPQIAEGRNLSEEQLKQIANELEGVLPHEALSAGLVDTLLFEKGLHNQLKETFGGRFIVDAASYALSAPKNNAKDHIAIIYAEGDVLDGVQTYGQSGIYSTTLSDALDAAAKEKDIKAIVLRINSPGGSVVASEIITDAVARAKAKKPVVISMGGMAASAGYEISCNGTAIVAMPTTLTGSIGVFATLPNCSRLLQEKLGIHTDTVLTNTNAASLGITRPLSAASRAMLQRNVESFYETFCTRVAKGRSLAVEYVDSIARGRVWTGEQALDNHLVDTLGTLLTAIDVAAQKAKVSTYSVKEITPDGNFMQRIIESKDRKHEIELTNRISAILPHYDLIRRWATMDPLQARLEFDLELQ